MAARSTPSVPHDTAWPAGTVFTVGHSTLPIERFIGVLSAYGIALLADIRKMPGSRHNPQFNGDALAPALAAASIDYAWMQGLGGLHRARADSPNAGWRNASFRGYADYMQTPEFDHAIEHLFAVSRGRRTAIMCAEAVPWRCHRALVADALYARGVTAVDIFSDTDWRRHALTPFAHVEGTRITYPPEQSALPGL